MVYVIYGKEDCPGCKKKCQEFDEKGISYEYVNVTTLNHSQLRELVSLSGKTSLPIIIEK